MSEAMQQAISRSSRAERTTTSCGECRRRKQKVRSSLSIPDLSPLVLFFLDGLDLLPVDVNEVARNYTRGPKAFSFSFCYYSSLQVQAGSVHPNTWDGFTCCCVKQAME
jgi:hypothetical protein